MNEKTPAQKAKDRYLREKVDEIKVIVPKGERAVIQAFAKSKGKSTNAYIVELINKDMGREM